MKGKGRGWVSLSVCIVVRCFFLPFSSTTVENFQQFSISMCHRQMRKYSWWGFLPFPSASPLNCNLKYLNLYICRSTFPEGRLIPHFLHRIHAVFSSNGHFYSVLSGFVVSLFLKISKGKPSKRKENVLFPLGIRKHRSSFYYIRRHEVVSSRLKYRKFSSKFSN